MPVKRKTKRTARSKVAPQRAPFNLVKAAVIEEAHAKLGWDPRVTRYISAKEELEKVQRDSNFTVQHPSLKSELVSHGYRLREIGALGDPVSLALARIVEVTPAPATPADKPA